MRAESRTEVLQRGRPGRLAHSPDVVTADSSKVIVLLNDGSGKFIQAHSYPSTAQPIADGDLNHDGKLDLLLSTADNSSGTPTFSLSVMLGNGDGTFGAATSTGIIGLSGVGINLIDLNGDQVPDLWFSRRRA